MTLQERKDKLVKLLSDMCEGSFVKCYGQKNCATCHEVIGVADYLIAHGVTFDVSKPKKEPMKCPFAEDMVCPNADENAEGFICEGCDPYLAFRDGGDLYRV